MGYSLEEYNSERTKKISKKEIACLYQWEYVKSPGPRGKGKPWTEMIAEELLENTEIWNALRENEPLKSSHYDIKDHDTDNPYTGKEPMPQSGTFPRGSKIEKHVAQWLVAKKPKSELGDLWNYETPLQDGGKNNIDIIATRGTKPVIIELKHKGNTESLLRAALEIATYKKLLNIGKLIEELKKRERTLEADQEPVLAVLLHEETKANQELNELLDPKSKRSREGLRKVLTGLGIEVFVYWVDKNDELKVEKKWPLP